MPADEVVDPRTVRPDFSPLRVDRPVYSRTRGGPTSSGLLGRLAVTGVVIALLPWGTFSPLSVIYLLGYVPVAIIVLRSTWAATPIDTSHILILPQRRARLTLRVGCVFLGGVMAVAGATSGGSWPAAIPGTVLLIASATPAWHGVMAGIAEMIEHPVAAFVALTVYHLTGWLVMA